MGRLSTRIYEAIFTASICIQLTREIHRQQKQNEQFKSYATEMLTKMRRAGILSSKEQLETIYENMSPDLKLYINRGNIQTVGELTALAAEYEEIEQRKEFRKPPVSPVATVYNKEECCWRCKQRGHTRQQCKRSARKFCSQCGKDRVLTKECHLFQGNSKRAGESAAAARSTE